MTEELKCPVCSSELTDNTAFYLCQNAKCLKAWTHNRAVAARSLERSADCEVAMPDAILRSLRDAAPLQRRIQLQLL